MTTYVAPGARLRPVINTAGDRMDKMLGLTLHVQQGNGSPYGEFNTPSAQASSTWAVAKDGTLEQYARSADIRMWAQGDGNETYCSVETAGFDSEPLTAAQMNTLARLYAWGHTTFGWPLALAEKPGQPGFGWHGMGCTPNWNGAQWGNHPYCPGIIRRGQRQQILNTARQMLAPKPPAKSTSKAKAGAAAAAVVAAGAAGGGASAVHTTSKPAPVVQPAPHSAAKPSASKLVAPSYLPTSKPTVKPTAIAMPALGGAHPSRASYLASIQLRKAQVILKVPVTGHDNARTSAVFGEVYHNPRKHVRALAALERLYGVPYGHLHTAWDHDIYLSGKA